MAGTRHILITTSSFAEHGREDLDRLEAHGYSVTLNPYGRRLSEDEVSALIADISPVGIIAGLEPLTERVISKAEGLRAISRLGAGMDNVDIDAARRLDIKVTSTPDAPTQAVAELTIGLIVSLLRSIPFGDGSIRGGKWERKPGRLLGGKTVGIVGCGRIGAAVAKLLRAFGAKVIGYDPYVKESADIEHVEWSALLAESDIITLHVPFIEETRGIINAEALGQMKNDAVIVNASRGGIVDEKALYEAVRDGRIGGACLDCFEDEPYKGPLSELPSVVCTPHIGSYTIETRMEMEREAVSNLLMALGEV